MTPAWTHEEGRRAEVKADLRDGRLEKERATAERMQLELKERWGVDCETKLPNGSVWLEVHKYLQVVFRYERIKAKRCVGVSLVSDPPARLEGLKKFTRHYAMSWQLEVPLPLNMDRLSAAMKKRLGELEAAEAQLQAERESATAFDAQVREAAKAAGVATEGGGGVVVVHPTVEHGASIRELGRSHGFTVMQGRLDGQAAIVLNASIDPEKVGLVAQAVRELAMDHGLRLR